MAYLCKSKHRFEGDLGIDFCLFAAETPGWWGGARLWSEWTWDFCFLGMDQIWKHDSVSSTDPLGVRQGSRCRKKWVMQRGLGHHLWAHTWGCSAQAVGAAGKWLPLDSAVSTGCGGCRKLASLRLCSYRSSCVSGCVEQNSPGRNDKHTCICGTSFLWVPVLCTCSKKVWKPLYVQIMMTLSYTVAFWGNQSFLRMFFAWLWPPRV